MTKAASLKVEAGAGHLLKVVVRRRVVMANLAESKIGEIFHLDIPTDYRR